MFDRLIDLLVSGWDHFKPILFILEYEEGVMFRAGKFKKVLKPGWHYRISFIDDYHVENVKGDTMSISPVSVTTLDNKTISIGCEFDFYIDDIEKALVYTNDWRSNLHDICKGILSDHLEDCNWEDIRKKVIKNQIFKRIEKRALEMGVVIDNFNFTDKSITRALTLYKGL
jgi:regulator of protease activity HflC (stomatin/prohibitin superfamily)